MGKSGGTSVGLGLWMVLRPPTTEIGGGAFVTGTGFCSKGSMCRGGVGEAVL